VLADCNKEEKTSIFPPILSFFSMENKQQNLLPATAKSHDWPDAVTQELVSVI